MATICFVGFRDGAESICIVNQHAMDEIPAEVVELAHMMAMEAMLADDAKFDRVISPYNTIRMRTSELVRVGEVCA